jgi:transcriptional regulator with XRE-family HTH domain
MLGALGHALRAQREALGRTQAEVAAEAKVNRAYLSELESGRRNPTVTTLARLGAALGVSLEGLMERSNL